MENKINENLVLPKLIEIDVDGVRFEWNSFDKALIECTNTKCKIQPSTWLRVKTDSVNKLVKIWNTRKLEE